MKKQLIALGLASILTVPSVVLAEATWYGSFRGIVHSQGGETSMMSNGSRWGVKGSSEVSEGLTAVYRYEENLNLANATLGAGNRLSSVGLSGGFGTVTLGQIWSASYNHVGVLTDNGVWSGNQSQTGRTGSALSYSASSGPVSFQIDANMNGGTGRSVDMAQLGMSFDTGAAKVGLAVITAESAKDSMRQSSIGVSVPVGGLTLYSSWSEKEVTTFATMGKDAVMALGTAAVTIPASDPVPIPGTDTASVTIPAQAAINIPAQAAINIPAQAEINIPARTEITVPAQAEINIPAREAKPVPSRAPVTAVAGTPDRCLIVRYANAEYGMSQRTDDRGRPLYYAFAPPPDGSDRPDDDDVSPAVTDWRVMDVDRTKFVRDEDLAGPDATDTTGGDIVDITHNNEVVQFRYSVNDGRLKETDEYKAWYTGTGRTGTFNELTGLIENRTPAPERYHCGEHNQITLPDGREAIVASIYQPAVQAVDAVAAGAPLAEIPAQAEINIAERAEINIAERAEINIPAQDAVNNPAQDAINIPAREVKTVPGRALVTIPATDPQDISGTVQVVLTPAVPAIPETTVKTRHMHAGVSGSLGDTGMSFAINVANHPDSSDGENPWNFNVSKSLGGGASLAFEYIDNDSMETSNEALVQLKVDF